MWLKCAAAIVLAASSILFRSGALADSASEPTPNTAAVKNYSSFFEIETRYSSWRGSRGSNVFDPTPGSGSQFYTPFTVGFDYQQPASYRLQGRLKSGYVHSNHSTPGQEASLDTMVDSQASATWTYLGSNAYQTFLGVALNLPTGKSVLSGNQRLTRMDPDLVDVGSYGAGFNVNPTTGVVFALTENTAMSLGVGYTWQGPFNREALDLTSVNNVLNCVGGCTFSPQFTATRHLEPGDVITANVNTSSIFNNLSIKTAFAAMFESETKQDGVSVSKSGVKYTADLGIVYKIDPRWSLTANIAWSFAAKNKISDGLGGLVTEPKNSHSHVVIGSIQPMYALTDQFSLGPNYSFLWRSDNYYDVVEEQFVPAKIKHSAGLVMNYAVSPTASIGLKASHFWVHADPGAYLDTGTLSTVSPLPPFSTTVTPLPRDFFPPSLNYTGWTVALSGRIQF